MILSKSDPDSAGLCADALRGGKIVIIPTDTVYGFSGLACGDSALDTASKIRAIKGRAEAKPFIQLLSGAEELEKYTDDKIPAWLLACWPGPLTIIVNDKNPLPGGGTTAYRVPGDEWLRKILCQLDFPVYSTSVNRSGLPVLATEDEIRSEFADDADLIVLDGDKKEALPSTIVSVAEGQVKLIRQGAVKLAGI